jgi:hypothetical protein
MGRRSIKNNDPADKNDRDVLEAVIDVDARDGVAARMPVGHRVVVVFGR